MSSYKEGQIHQLADALENAGYSPADITALGQSSVLLEQIRLVIIGLADIIRLQTKFKDIKAFSPAYFLGNGWAVWKGPIDGDGLNGQEDRDVREDDLSDINWSQVMFETNLKKDEKFVYGEEKMKRLKAGNNIRLGGRSFLFLWHDYRVNGSDSILESLSKSGIENIYFFGLVLRGPNSQRLILYLGKDIQNKWHWSYTNLNLSFSIIKPSASIPCEQGK